MPGGRQRLDLLLVERGLFPTRERARAAVMEGRVLVADHRIDKPGVQVGVEDELRLTGEDPPYVSRGGLKLRKAIEEFGLDLQGKVVLDVGASTGGFTDCVLQAGAARVFSVDVGYGQLAWKLRQDPRVVCLERTNARYLQPEQLGERVAVAVGDVSFISLEKILPAIRSVLFPGGHFLALVKPQFEAGKEYVGKKGVVRDPLVHRQVLLRLSQAALSLGFSLSGLTFSPLAGPEGNREYLLWLTNNPGAEPSGWEDNIADVVERAHLEVRSV